MTRIACINCFVTNIMISTNISHTIFPNYHEGLKCSCHDIFMFNI